MKRKVLALVIPALLAAGAAHAAEIYNKDGNKLDLYGKVDGLHYFSSDSKKDGDQTYLRFGFKGETQINDMLTGYGQWEYNVQANNTETSSDQAWTRLAFAGIKVGDYGSFDYGRNYGVLYDVEGWTDMLPEFGGDSYTYADNFMAGRANGVATYRNSDFFGLVEGLNFALQYQGKNEGQNAQDINVGTNNRSSDSDVRFDNGDGFGLSTSYDFGMGISAAAAYTSSDRTNDQMTQTNARGDKAEAWTAGLKYDANDIYLATMPLSAKEWKQLSSQWREELDRRIHTLVALRDELDGCIGCGCLSRSDCPLRNPGDQLGEQGTGARLLEDD